MLKQENPRFQRQIATSEMYVAPLEKTTSEMYVALLIGSMKNDIRDVCSTADWHLGIPKILGDTQNFGFTRNIG